MPVTAVRTALSQVAADRRGRAIPTLVVLPAPSRGEAWYAYTVDGNFRIVTNCTCSPSVRQRTGRPHHRRAGGPWSRAKLFPGGARIVSVALHSCAILLVLWFPAGPEHVCNAGGVAGAPWVGRWAGCVLPCAPRDSPSTPRAGLPAKRGPGYDPGGKGDRSPGS